MKTTKDYFGVVNRNCNWNRVPTSYVITIFIICTTVSLLELAIEKFTQELFGRN